MIARIYRTLLIASVVLFPHNAFACPQKETAELYDINQFTEIYVAVVLDVEKLPNTVSDWTQPHDMRLRVLETLIGEDRKLHELEGVTGCGVSIPSSGAIGMFFDSEDTLVIPTYEYEHETFSDYIDEIRKKVEQAN